MLEMYSAKINSPETEITAAINATDTAITVDDISVIPDAPNLLVVGGDTEEPETVKLTAISENVLTVERGFQGTAKEWPAGTKIARNFTAYDHDVFKENIEQLDERMSVPKYATEEGYPDVLSIPNTAVDGDMKVGIKGQTVQNLVKRGIENWSNATLVNGILQITGSGTNSYSYTLQALKPPATENRKIYARMKCRVTNADCTQINLSLNATGGNDLSTGILSPVRDKWYNLSHIFTIPAGRTGNINIILQHIYPDATTATNKIMEVEEKSIFAVDMGIDSTNPFYNKTVEQMDSMFAQWTDDLSSTLGSKRVRSLGRELFDMEDLLKIGFKKDANGDYYVDNPNVPLRKVLYENKGRYEGQYTIQINGKYIDTANPNLPGVLAKVQYTDNTVSSDILLGGYNNFSTVTYTTTPNKTVDFIYFGYGWNNPSYIRDLKIQKGTSISEEPYTEDIAYITAEKCGELQELRNVPNGVADEIRLNSDGNGLEFVKRCEKVIIDGNTNISVLQTVMNEDTFVVQFRLLDIPYSTVSTSVDDIAWFIIDGIKFTNQDGYGVADNRWKVAYNYYVGRDNSNSYVDTMFSIPKTDVDWTAVPTLQQVKDYLNAHPITLIYQLLQEEVTQIQWTGLTCKKDGTVLIETIVPEVGFYGTQATTKHPAQLIGSVDRLYKVDRDTGVRTRLDVSKCVIASDKLGFTHPDLTDGDLLDWDYVPEVSYTQGYKSITVPTNMSATVEGLVENSKVQKENIEQLKYKIETAGKVQSVNGKTGEVEITKDDVGLENVDNTADIDKPVSTAQQTAIDDAIGAITKDDVGLSNVDNTADIDKPVSTAQQAAIENAIGAIPPASGKKSARFVIGNTGAGWTTSDCDYLCDGANDEVEIQAAINALPTTGGEIILLDGNYSIAANIQVDRVRTHIRGNGNGTILTKAFSSYGEAGAMFAVRTVGVIISNMSFYGNGGQNSVLWTVSADYLSIHNCYFTNFKYGLYCDTSNYTKVESCHFALVGIGIRLTGSNYCVINNNTCNITNLAEVFNSNSNTIIGNTINNPTVGITLYNSSSHNVVSGNAIAYADLKAISVESMCNSISGNTTISNPIGIDVSVGHNSISGNVSNMDSIGIYISGDSGCTINSNVIHRDSYIDSQHSILLESTVIDCVVTGNICKEKDIEGDTSSNIIANNIGTGTTG